MNILIDMNLSPQWCEILRAHGHEVRHWSEIGDIRAADEVIMAWARANGFVVLTSDLDSGDLLALTRMAGPIVAQLRVRSTLPSRVGVLVVTALDRCVQDLAAGALVTRDDRRASDTHPRAAVPFGSGLNLAGRALDAAARSRGAWTYLLEAIFDVAPWPSG